MTIDFYRKAVYGKVNTYIKNDEQALLIRKLTGKKTIDMDDIKALQELGVTFKEVLPVY